MKTSILLTLTLVVCAPLFAIDVDPKLDKAIRASLPVCADAKVSYEAVPLKLPAHFTGVMVEIKSERPTCGGQMIAALSPTGGLFLGSPWPIEGEEGNTVEEKLAAFTVRNLHEAMTVTVDRTPTEDGLWPVTLMQTTEAGKLPMLGFADPQGKIFFFGPFRRMNGDLSAQRAKLLEPFLANSPTKGKGPVTIIEFSDFQCPSCRRSSGYVDAILEKHPDQVRYIRFDMPLAMHPWAFPAALAGRAIYRQQPELFWQYKKNVYDSQSEMTAFVFWDWARHWVEDHDLDLKRYDADLADEALKTQLLKGAGTALSNDVRATPTYMVNGTLVDYGDEGKALAEYVDKLLTK
ncbi:MAG: thioredoxin domain-containing protein [Acidobacteriota bacterium]